jgi:hypothetical protein
VIDGGVGLLFSTFFSQGEEPLVKFIHSPFYLGERLVTKDSLLILKLPLEQVKLLLLTHLQVLLSRYLTQLWHKLHLILIS